MPQQSFGVGTVPLVLKVGERVTLICSSGCAGFISVPGEAVAQTITAGASYDYGGYSVQREVVVNISAGTVAVNFNTDGSQYWTQSQADSLQALVSGDGIISSSRSVGDTDRGRVLIYSGSSDIVLTLNAGLPPGMHFTVVQSGAGRVSVVAGTASLSGTAITSGADTSITVVSIGTDTYRAIAPYDVRPRSGFLSTSNGAAPYGIATSGTVTGFGVGNLVLGTSLPETYAEGVWLYFPSTAFSSSAAGWYFCVMSSPTVGTVYVDSSAGSIVAGSGSGYLGVTTSVTLPVSVTPSIPASSIGINGGVYFKGLIGVTNNANAKSVTLTVGGSLLVNAVSLASMAAMPVKKELRNQGVSNLQRTNGTNTFSMESGGGAVVRTSIDTTADVAVVLSMTRGTATDNMILNWFGYDYV